MNVWRPKAGDYVQIWDRLAVSSDDDEYINDHGKFGYIVRESKQDDTFIDGAGNERRLPGFIVQGDVFKVIVFEKNGARTIHVHHDNLRSV